MDRLIKDIDTESWKAFRAEAAKHGLKAGEFLDYLIEEHVKTEKKSNWERVLSKEASLTEREAAKIRESIRIFENEYDFE